MKAEKQWDTPEPAPVTMAVFPASEVAIMGSLMCKRQDEDRGSLQSLHRGRLTELYATCSRVYSRVLERIKLALAMTSKSGVENTSQQW